MNCPRCKTPKMETEYVLNINPVSGENDVPAALYYCSICCKEYMWMKGDGMKARSEDDYHMPEYLGKMYMGEYFMGMEEN